ncbi:MAG: carotenoid biosynthesis protein [Saprospiraceae bacterium]|nr:carotenoid biosynthesis protein [Saprospiraceae bacterium]
MTELQKDKLAIAILLLLYGVGITALWFEVHPDFILLTPFNLLISAALLIWRHPVKDRAMWSFIGLCYAIGFIVEMAGVQTGMIFGEYEYGIVLGPKLLGTPLLIGVNWVILVYASAVTADRFFGKMPRYLRTALAAAVMVALDVLIEPVAVGFGFWSWAGGVIPLQNYLAWYVLAFLLIALFYQLHRLQVFNKVALVLLVLQFLFFGILNASL